MTFDEIRSAYLTFFKERGHAVIPSASLVPENDPTTLFTGSGMQPLVPYLLGKNHPEGSRIVDSQKCFRAMDIEEVGDNRHTTFFEMLGNWSLGDYFKQDQLPWFFEFLTDVVGLDPTRLYVTVFIGDEKNGIPRDTESVAIWQKLFAGKGVEAKDALIGSEADGYERGMREGERIFYYDAKKNWWSRSGVPEAMPVGEPGGPDSEVFYDFGTPHDAKYGKECHPNCDCGRFMEIGNSVFMQYVKKEDGSFALLPKQNVDFGGGLERIAAASLGDNDVFRISIFERFFDALALQYGIRYTEASGEQKRKLRVIADHLRAAVFIAADGVLPSNTERGYFLRRLLRRSIFFGHDLVPGFSDLYQLADSFIDGYGEAYPELLEARPGMHAAFKEEETRFNKTIEQGRKEFEKLSKQGGLSGDDVYLLFTTHGFPYELIVELAAGRGISVDVDGFKSRMEEHRSTSRAGAEQKFKGGLADTAEQTVRLHTAHHLLLRALQIVLGPEVKQRGSNITQERLRIDFSYPQKLTKEQLAEVERIVNERIAEDLPVIRSEMSREEAEKLGAEHEFGQKYPERVSVYSVGPKDATEENPRFDERFSIEFCGGPHVSHTGALSEGGMSFKIQKEEAVSAGVRRIKAVLTKN